MPEVNYIKHLRDNEDLTINEIARKTGKNWRTIKKYADGEVPLEPLLFNKRGMMYEQGYGEIVDCWIEEDMKLKKKERRTSKKMFEQLRDEHSFNGSYRTVCEYVQQRRPIIKKEKSTRYERLEHPPGEAQVDFGNMTVGELEEAVKEGTLQRLKRQIEKCDLLILDELGYVPFQKQGSELLFHIIADCYEHKSVIVTSNLEFGQWNRVFGDNRLTVHGGPLGPPCTYSSLYRGKLPVKKCPFYSENA